MLLMAIISGAGAVEQITSVDVNTVEQAIETALTLSVDDIKVVVNDIKPFQASVIESIDTLKDEALRVGKVTKISK